MTDRSDAFLECLKEVVSPELTRIGFQFDRSRTYRRISQDHASVEIINFQLGQRSLKGKFTVNLGVLFKEPGKDIEFKKAYPYHCQYQARIGEVLPPRSERLKDIPYLGMFFGAHDKWWRFSGDKEFTLRQVNIVFEKINNYAIPWLVKHLS